MLTPEQKLDLINTYNARIREYRGQPGRANWEVIGGQECARALLEQGPCGNCSHAVVGSYNELACKQNREQHAGEYLFDVIAGNFDCPDYK